MKATVSKNIVPVESVYSDRNAMLAAQMRGGEFELIDIKIDKPLSLFKTRARSRCDFSYLASKRFKYYYLRGSDPKEPKEQNCHESPD